MDVPRGVQLHLVSTHAPARGATSAQPALPGETRFQLTRPRGARPPARATPWALPSFQLTRTRGARRLPDLLDMLDKSFQLTRPRGARLESAGNHVFPGDVSTHAPARGATRDSACTQRQQRSFNSRAREGRDQPSTLAPATPSRFNSRAREGRDVFSLTSAPAAISFNSRAREGRDLLRRHARGDRQVSTHAPARGATTRVCQGSKHDFVSTHAPARGATPRRCFFLLDIVFQLTRPRGARPQLAGIIALAISFNSRAREGRDSRGWGRRARRGCFNSRAREGRDTFGTECTRASGRFNSRAREGRDLGWHC